MFVWPANVNDHFRQERIAIVVLAADVDVRLGEVASEDLSEDLAQCDGWFAVPDVLRTTAVGVGDALNAWLVWGLGRCLWSASLARGWRLPMARAPRGAHAGIDS